MSPPLRSGSSWSPGSGGIGQQRLVRGVEAALDLGGQGGVPLVEGGPDGVEGRPRAVQVGLEVDQVGARVALLLAGDLRLRDLAEQLVGAVGDLRGVELDGADLALQLGHVGAASTKVLVPLTSRPVWSST
jgi:hypothetical protein